MTKNPFLNALLAIAYVSIMATFIFYVQRMGGHGQIDIFLSANKDIFRW